jgi:hypothetical protein
MATTKFVSIAQNYFDKRRDKTAIVQFFRCICPQG